MYKLCLDIVHLSSWINNVRAILTKKQWDEIRSRIYSESYYVCQICGGVGNKHPVEAHEVWSYDEINFIQKLEDIISLCPNCHMVKHFGLAEVQGKREKALQHLMKINKISRKQAEDYINLEFAIWASRSAKKWTLDISKLKDYGVDIDGSTIKRKNNTSTSRRRTKAKSRKRKTISSKKRRTG